MDRPNICEQCRECCWNCWV